MTIALDTNDLLAPKAEPKRDRWGRYLIVPQAGGKAVAHTRATTVAETLDDRYNLELWKMRQVALGLAARPDLLAQAAAHTADDKAVLNDVCSQAMDAAAAKSGANLGTALHRIVERHNSGQLDDCPEMFAERLAAYRDALDSAGVVVRRDLIERVAVLGRHIIAGTFDAGVEIGGRLYVADLKTGSGVDYGARGFSVQLAIYATAETLYDYRTDTHSDAPGFDTERAVIIHLPAAGGPCDLHWIDIAAGADALEHAMWVRSWRKRNVITPFAAPPAVEEPAADDTEVGDASPGDSDTRAWIVGRIAAMPPNAVAVLAARWPVGVPTFKASDAHTAQQLGAIGDAVSSVERDLDLAFPPLHPADIAAIEKKAAAMFDRAPRPAPAGRPAPFDEGPDVVDGRIGTLKATVTMLSSETQEELRLWAGQAKEAGRSISLATGRSTWRYAVVAAAVDLATATDDDDVRRCILGLALGDEVQPAATIGAALASLDIESAATVQRISRALAEGQLTADGGAVYGAALAGLMVPSAA